MSTLLQEEVFRAVHMMDYQAVCFRHKFNTTYSNPSTMLYTVSATFMALITVGPRYKKKLNRRMPTYSVIADEFG